MKTKKTNQEDPQHEAVPSEETAIVPASAVPAELDNAREFEAGMQLAEQYKKAVGAMREVLIFGAMLWRVREEFCVESKNLSARGQVSANKGGRGKKGGLEDWLKRFCPQVSHAAAYRFLGVFKSVRQQYLVSLPAGVDKVGGFEGFIQADPEALPPKLQRKQLELWEELQGTSQRSWLDKFREKKPLGGARTKGIPAEGLRADNAYYAGATEDTPALAAQDMWRPVIRALCNGIDSGSWADLPRPVIDELDGALLDLHRAIRGNKTQP